MIAEGAHHLDLMFSHEDDPVSVKLARIVEAQHITGWIREYRAQVAHRKAAYATK